MHLSETQTLLGIQATAQVNTSVNGTGQQSLLVAPPTIVCDFKDEIDLFLRCNFFDKCFFFIINGFNVMRKRM